MKVFLFISGIYNLDNYASHSTLIGAWSIWLVPQIFLYKLHVQILNVTDIKLFFKDEMLTYDAM